MKMVERMARAVLSKVPEGYGMREDEARGYALAALRAMREPSEDMASLGRAALREGGLLPAYTDKGSSGQTPILHTLIRDNLWPAMIDAAIREAEAE